jgi:hypothetical protein
MPTHKTNRARLSLDIDARTKKEIEILLVRTQAPTITALIKKSIALFDVIDAHRTSGGTVIFRHANGKEEQIKIL